MLELSNARHQLFCCIENHGEKTPRDCVESVVSFSALLQRSEVPYTNSCSEKQIELIQERLHSIERSISNLTLATKSTPSSTAGESQSETLPPYKSETIEAFEGESSFSSQTKSTTKEADITISKAFGAAADNEVVAALSSLRSILKHNVMPHAHEAYLAKSMRRAAPPELEPVPASVVAAVIKRIKGL